MATRQNLLSDEELAALSEGLKDGSIETDTGFNTKVRVRKHDLASENSSLGVNVSSIDMINERFIRMFRLGLLEGRNGEKMSIGKYNSLPLNPS